MEMRHRLATIDPDVCHHPIPPLGQALLASHLTHDPLQVPNEPLVVFGHVVQRRDRLFGDHQEMDRRLGMDVPERQRDVVLKEDRGRNLFSYDL